MQLLPVLHGIGRLKCLLSETQQPFEAPGMFPAQCRNAVPQCGGRFTKRPAVRKQGIELLPHTRQFLPDGRKPLDDAVGLRHGRITGITRIGTHIQIYGVLAVHSSLRVHDVIHVIHAVLLVPAATAGPDDASRSGNVR